MQLQMNAQRVQKGYFALALAVIGLFLSAYATINTAHVAGIRGYFDTTVVVFFFTALALALVTVIHLIAAWGLLLGCVDKVFGTQSCATIILNGKSIVDNSKIYYHKYIGDDDNLIPRNSQTVLFVCAWRPWSCAIEEYLVESVVVDKKLMRSSKE